MDAKLEKLSQVLKEEMADQRAKQGDSDSELLEHGGDFGFLFNTEREASGQDITLKKPEATIVAKQRGRPRKASKKDGNQTLNQFIKNKRQKAEDKQETALGAGD